MDISMGFYLMGCGVTGVEMVNSAIGKHVENLHVSAQNVNVGENVVVKHTITDGATGNVVITIDGKTYYVTAGTPLTLSGLSNGTYDISAQYLDGDNYESSSNTASVTVSKVALTTTVTADAINYDVAEVSINMAATDVTGNVNVTIGDQTKTVALVNGATKAYFSGLTTNGATITANYLGDKSIMQVLVLLP